MKKVVLTLVAAALMTVTYAQNISENTAALSQSGSGNNSNSAQNGYSQSVNIVQSGTNNINTNEQSSNLFVSTTVNQTGFKIQRRPTNWTMQAHPA
jgi:hypothetical protein